MRKKEIASRMRSESGSKPVERSLAVSSGACILFRAKMSLRNPSAIAEIINKVKENPILYNTTLDEFKNTHCKNVIWNSIAKEVGAKNGDEVYWKFKNLRDTYSKYKRHKSNPPNVLHGVKTHLLNWRWASSMTFLDPFMRNTKDLPTNEQNDDGEFEIPLEETKVEYKDSSDEGPEPSDTFQPESQFITSESEDVNKKRKYAETLDEVTIDSYRMDSSPHNLDRVDYLFLSYADTFKRLNRKRQALLKVKLAKMFASAELLEIETDPIKLKMTFDSD